MEIVVVLYIVGIALIIGYLINRYPSYYIPLRNRCITSYPKMSSSKIKRTMHM